MPRCEADHKDGGVCLRRYTREDLPCPAASEHAPDLGHEPTYEADYGVRFVCSCGEVSRYYTSRAAAAEAHGYHVAPETEPKRLGTTVLEMSR